MAFRRLLFTVLVVSCLPLGYLLYVTLDGRLSWSIDPLRPFQEAGRDSDDPLDLSGQSPPPPSASTPHPKHLLAVATQTHTPSTRTLALKTSKVAEQKPGNVSGADETRTRTGAPQLQPQQSRAAAQPTEPPYIGDAYMSDPVPPPTNCSDGIRSRIAKTQFGGRFLERVPVLQWAGHATREQHVRLSRYPGAHGWGGVAYQTLVETLRVLNSSANVQMLDDWARRRRNATDCVRCAVVGNGGILKNSKKGAEIDAHDYVFRTNGAVIKGFEQDVGTRTTHYTFSTNTLMNSMRSYAGVGYRGPPVSKETRYIFLPDHDRDYLLMKAAATHTTVERGPERGKEYFGEDVTVEKLKMYHPDFVRYLRNRFLRSGTLKTKHKDIYRPSTGAVMLLAALHTCDQVDAYGFMTPDYSKYSDHYYDSSFHPVGFYINHDLRLEMALWQQLHQAGLMRLYMHQ